MSYHTTYIQYPPESSRCWTRAGNQRLRRSRPVPRYYQIYWYFFIYFLYLFSSFNLLRFTSSQVPGRKCVLAGIRNRDSFIRDRSTRQTRFYIYVNDEFTPITMGSSSIVNRKLIDMIVRMIFEFERIFIVVFKDHCCVGPNELYESQIDVGKKCFVYVRLCRLIWFCF